MRISVALACLAALTSCQAADPDESLSRSQQSIIGGTADHQDHAVVAVFVGGLCTGTLIAPRIVLTAAHCVGDAIEAGATNVGSVRFGDGEGPWIDSIGIVDMTMHRLYEPPAFLQHDIALLRLGRAAPDSIAPLPISTRDLSADDVGLEIRIVGFGNNDGAAGTGAGTKRQVTLPLKEVHKRHITIGDRLYNTCQGDSGGPSFASFDGVEHVVGVTSYGATGCAGLSNMTRTDAMWDEFLTEVISAWSGPCQNDGECVEDASCAFPDPDCDPCGMDGQCATGCPQPDRDCPLGGLAADRCTSDIDCETRSCASAPEDDRIQYCSMSCDPAVANSESGCFAPLTICEDQGDGTGICGFAGITPGAQGSLCSDGGQCRSGMCDSNEGICVEPCGDQLPECAEGFSCQSAGDFQICSIPGDGGCHLARGRDGATGGLLLLLAMALASRKRRRRE